MPTFIDESGDTSDHADAQPFFRLAAVWVPQERADALRAELARVRTQFGLPARYEFKYSKTHSRPHWRAAFYAAVRTHGARFAVACIDKREGAWHGLDRAEFFTTTTFYLAATLRPIYLEAEAATGKLLREPVIVDDNDDGVFLECVRHAFRGLHSRLKPGVPLVQNPKFAASHVAELLQVADMVCGAAGEMLDGNSTFYAMIESVGLKCGHCAGVTCWP